MEGGWVVRITWPNLTPDSLSFISLFFVTLEQLCLMNQLIHFLYRTSVNRSLSPTPGMKGTGLPLVELNKLLLVEWFQIIIRD